MIATESPPPGRARPLRRMLAWATVAVALAAAGLFVAVWLYQTRGVYDFDRTVTTPAEVGLPAARVVSFASEDGAEVSAWLVAPAPGRPVLISFFGGFACVGPSAKRMQPLLERGFGLAMLVYRGSSGDPHEPTERAFAMDARVLYDRLDALLGEVVPPERRVLHGVSLGSSVAAGLAGERPALALVLEASFDRCCRWHSKRMLHLPMCLLMWRERHDVIDKLGTAPMPKLILHGERDRAVPIAWARALYDALDGAKRWIAYPEGDHMDLLERGAAADIAAFVAESAR